MRYEVRTYGSVSLYARMDAKEMVRIEILTPMPDKSGFPLPQARLQILAVLPFCVQASLIRSMVMFLKLITLRS